MIIYDLKFMNNCHCLFHFFYVILYMSKDRDLFKKLKKRSIEADDRPSPSWSATIYDLGTVRTGNDGEKWTIVENKNGVRRWQRLKKGGSRKSSRNHSQNNSRNRSRNGSRNGSQNNPRNRLRNNSRNNSRNGSRNRSRNGPRRNSRRNLLF